MRSNSLDIRIFVLFVLLITGCLPATTPEIETEKETADCKQIVFSYSIHGYNGFEENIVSICPDGTEKRRLTVDTYGNFGPSWSSDGSVIAFLSRRSGTWQLHVMDQDGGNIRQITFRLDIGDWFWLPDGNRIAVMTTSGDGEKSWQEVNVVTKNIIPLADRSYDFLIAPAVFSHDGTRLAYLALPEQAEGIDSLPYSTQVHIRNIDGSNDFVLTTDDWYIYRPVWSPDDSQIAFLSQWDRPSDQFAIYMVNVDGSNLHRIIDSSDLQRVIELEFSQPFSFTWSPDGGSFAIYAHGSFYILDLKSAEISVLFSVDEPNYISGLSWQP